jgi:hypothetical protein
VNSELEIIWKEAVMTNLKYYVRICLTELRKSTAYFSRYSRYPGSDLNRILPKYKSEEFPIEPTCLMEDNIKRDRKVSGGLF